MKNMIALAMALLLILTSSCALGEGTETWLSDMLSGMVTTIAVQAGTENTAEADVERKHVALLFIEGEILEGDRTYDHAGTLTMIDELMMDEDNVALLLVLNTPGGGLYESDELHHALMTYKAMTGRPVYAYMKQECCSGGVYAAMAADTIYASKMTITGSVGVYVQTTSEAGLLQKLGIEQEYITTGENKVSGYPTLTPEQRAIEQAMVDEGFTFFKQVIREGRGLTDEQMASFTDGRILTALQAKELGLIDEVMYYDEAIEAIMAELGGDVMFEDITPAPQASLEDMISYYLLDGLLP